MAQKTRERAAAHHLTAHDGDEPDSPQELDRGSWGAVLKRTLREFKEDDLTDWAAALTYYAILSLFPGLLLLFSGSPAARPRSR